MITLHRDSPGDLLGRIICPGDQPITLIVPVLPPQPVLDQLAISANQHGRDLRVVTELYGPGPLCTRRQIDSLQRLAKIGVRIKTAERGRLPSLLLAPPAGCSLLPRLWGSEFDHWQLPVIIESGSAGEIFELGDSIWNSSQASHGSRSLSTLARWLEEIIDEANTACNEKGGGPDGEIRLSELTLFDKRRGTSRKKKKRENHAWWTFHGTADDRVNPFLPVRTWALQREIHQMIRFPAGRRPTGVKTGDDIFFIVHSRSMSGDLESYIVGRGCAIAYRPLVDDASDDERAANPYLDRFPHAINLETVRFINGAVGEGVPVQKLMGKLGADLFDSTRKNKRSGKGNTDPHRSTGQKSIIQLAENGIDTSRKLLGDRLDMLGSVSAPEISGIEG